MTLEEQLKDLPIEFTLGMERAKDLQFANVVEFALSKYKIDNEFNEMNDEVKVTLLLFLKHIYNYAFYAGVSYSIDPDAFIEEYSPKDDE